jgi:hypothetical protein
MNNTSPNTQTQNGNAVTMTLLGLAVAILAGVAMLYYIGRTGPDHIPATFPDDIDDENTDVSEPLDPRAGWRTYQDSALDISVQYPSGWIVVSGTVLGARVVTLYADGQEVPDTLAGVHETAFRVSIYPQGLPMGSAGEREAPSNVAMSVAGAHVRNLVLGNGTPWAARVRFERSPISWDQAGFILARVPVMDEQVGYIRGDVGISPEEFDVYSGDEMVRYGYVDRQQWATVVSILESFSFTDREERSDRPAWMSWRVDELIRVDEPRVDSVVRSPLRIRGEARGMWYFEASFPVRLETLDGEVLAEASATAGSDWMTEEFVPFDLLLAFPETSAVEGVLVLERDNPTGMPEYDRALRIPVRFGQ